MDVGNIGLLLTFCLGLAAIWIAFSRFRMRLDNSWPLIFYLALVIYSNTYDRVLNPYLLYVAVICALLLRFEFMNERIVYFVRIVEVAALALIAWRLGSVLIRAY
jgi:hypothetical protein